MSIELLQFTGSRNRLPMIRQSEASECGLACLAMVAGYYGFETSLASLRRQYNTSLRGMTFKTIVNIADKMGLMSRGLKVEIEDIGSLKLPAILHWDLTHFVVLKSVSNKKIEIYDPGTGRKSYRLDEFSKHFTGVALELMPTTNFEKKNEPLRLKISDLWGQITGLKRSLVQLLLLTLFLQISALISPLFLQNVVDEVLQKYNESLLLILALGFAGLAVVDVLTNVLRQYVSIYLGNTLSFQMASNLFRHLLSLPIEYFEKRHMGDINSRFTSIDPIRTMLTEKLIGGLLDVIMVITTFIMMMIYSPTLAIISLVSLVGYFIIRMIMFHTLKERQEASIAASAKQSSSFMEAVRSVTSIKLFGGEADRHRKWQNLYADSINTSVSVQRLEIWFDAGQSILTGLEMVLIIYLAALMVIAGDFTVGMIFAFLAYRTNFIGKAQSLITLAIDYRMLSLHLERISDIVYTDPETILGEDVSDVSEPLNGLIELKNIVYRYSFDSPKILDDLSLTVNAGESIAIVGPTGCGKTTLLKVMATLLSPQEGEIFLDGKLINNIGSKNYRQQIGVVMQEDGLMTGTIAENIAFFDSEINMERVREAAREACVLEDIVALPMTFQSLIGEMGAALSGGQKQRLAIARALYRKPKVLFLDEGTSHLDVGTEKLINKSIGSMGITRIIVAHRPETIRSADRVFLCENGKLTEMFDEISYGNTTISLNLKSSNTGEGFTPSPEKEVGS